jgi:multidrug efflux pump subunit AcrB
VTAAEFDGTDTSALVGLAEDAVEKQFNQEKLAEYGLSEGSIKTDLGVEGDFQESFNTMVFAFPILLIAIYLLLVFQFRSLLQPALIFMAIPFSLLGIAGGLWVTDNAFSFFTMLGFFALLGLSIKNTILLTDYANQARREGHTAIESVAISLQERFRPLIATSFTAIVSLIPLYLSNPFWEGLTVTLIFGLLSSTFLVITVFPYYYLGAEYLRLRIRRRTFLVWLVLSIALSVGLSLSGYPALVPLAILATTTGMAVYMRTRRIA